MYWCNYLGQGDINAKLLDKWYDLGIRYVSSRTIGLNHIDLEHAKEIGIQVCNAKYPPNGVAGICFNAFINVYEKL